jgi:phospholipase D1/2
VQRKSHNSDQPIIEVRQNDGISRPKALVLLVILLGLPLLWRWTPLYDWFNLRTILAWQESVKNDPAAPLYVLAAYLIGSLCFFPVMILNLATVFAFGPIWGNIYALGGWLLSSAEGFGIGRLIGKDLLHKLAGQRLTPLVDRLEQHGFLAVLAMRLVPIGPFTLVNLFIGASGIRFWDFFLASVVGRVPGMLILTLFAAQIENALRRPGLISFGLLGFALIVVPLVISRFTKRYADRDKRRSGPNS